MVEIAFDIGEMRNAIIGSPNLPGLTQPGFMGLFRHVLQNGKITGFTLFFPIIQYFSECCHADFLLMALRLNTGSEWTEAG
ncbi:MAG TPA: hypothetical protein PLG50_08130 [bacterium]|nr:hypothetical protein [bacterium]